MAVYFCWRCCHGSEFLVAVAMPLFLVVVSWLCFSWWWWWCDSSVLLVVFLVVSRLVFLVLVVSQLCVSGGVIVGVSGGVMAQCFWW